MNKSSHFLSLIGYLFVLLIAASCSGETATPTAAAPDVENTAAPQATAAPEVTEIDFSPEIITYTATNTDSAETMLIPASLFWMGSDDTDAAADADEKPLHRVALDDFYIYTHEVTNEMYNACVAAGGCAPVNELEQGPTALTSDPAYASYPVTGVTWTMAQTYCSWAGGRLPTEAEWELAARGVDSLLYPWGADEPDCSKANLAGCSDPAGTVEVGSYADGNSPYGVWDMSGNVWEWVNDWYSDVTYQFSQSGNPFGPSIYQDETNPLKVVRGGSYLSDAAQARGASRLGIDPSMGYDDVGFRCVASRPLELPEDYVAPDGEIISTGPGNTAGGTLPSSSWSATFQARFATCPDVNGLIHLEMQIITMPGTTFSLSLGGTEFACFYSEDQGVLSCDGPAPAEFLDENVSYVIPTIHVENPTYSISKDIDSITIPEPAYCAPENEDGDIQVGVSAACGKDGASVNITYDSSVFQLGAVTLGHRTLHCSFTADGQSCWIPGSILGESNTLSLTGKDADGNRTMITESLPGLACEIEEADDTVEMDAICYGSPALAVWYNPAAHGSLVSAMIDGASRSAYNASQTSALISLSGITAETSITAQVCFADGTCVEKSGIVVVGCGSSGGDTEDNFITDLTGFCASMGTRHIALFRFSYDEEAHGTYSAVYDDGQQTGCHSAPNSATCPFSDSTAGREAQISACFDDGTCTDVGAVAVQDCNPGTADDTHSFLVLAGCQFASSGNQHSLSVRVIPNDQTVASVTMDGTALVCNYNAGTGTYSCSGIPEGAAGAAREVTTCLANGECNTSSVTLSAKCKKDPEQIVGGYGIQTSCRASSSSDPVMQVEMTEPQGESHRTIVSATTSSGDLIACSYSYATRVQTCWPITGEAGETVDFTFCLDDGNCNTVPVVIDGSCGVTESSEPPVASPYDVLSLCREDGTGGFYNVAAVNVGPAGPGKPQLVSASASTVGELDCHYAGGTHSYACGNVTGEAGASYDFNFCMSDGNCYTEPLTMNGSCIDEGQSDITYHIAGACEADTGASAVRLYVVGEDIASISENGTELSISHQDGARQYIGYPITAAAGEETTIGFCLTNGNCYSTPFIAKACEAEPEQPELHIYPAVVCRGEQPAFRFRYSPDDFPVDTVTGSDGELNCSIGAINTCYPIPGEPGTISQLELCLINQNCYDVSLLVKDCGGDDESETSGNGAWSKVNVGCVTPYVPDTYFFTIDTGLDWVSSGNGVIIYPQYPGMDYDCTLENSVTGRIACWGKKPTDDSMLRICITGTGGAQACYNFFDFPSWFNGIKCNPSINVTEEAPGSSEVNPPVVTGCPSYTTLESCTAHASEGCEWSYAPQNVCFKSE